MANERLTDFEMVYDMSDITALGDSTPTANTNKSFADIDLLKLMQKTPGQMTLEHNYCVLDGSQEEFDDTPTAIAFFTNYKSDENGDFDTIPKIDVSFTEYHSSYALTISFIDDYPVQIRCTWYQDEAVIYRRVYDVDIQDYIIRQPIQNYNHLTIEFIKALPDRYVKVNFIRYGMLMHWTQNDVKTATLVMEADRLSNQLSTNTLTFTVIDPEDETNPGNKEGLHNYFQKTQVMYPYEMVNGQRIDLGKFYLDTFSYQKNVCTVNAVSYMGLLETVQYEKSEIYNGIKAGLVIDDIFSVIGLEDYTVDEVTYNQLLYGSIAPCTCKDALQQILFACNSVIDTTDLENIKIYKTTEIISAQLDRNLKLTTKVTKLDYTSGVQITYKAYMADSDAQELVNDAYEAGSYHVVFTEPHFDYTISGGTITGSGKYYVDFTVSSALATTVTISGKGYDIVEKSITVNRPYKEAGEGENVKTFNTTLCNAITAKQLATKILRYYEMRLEIEVKHLAVDAFMNKRQLIANSTKGMEDYIGTYIGRTLDLTGGFIDNAKFVGYFDTADYYYFITDDGNDLIMDENGVI